ncbi:beta-ketoacyl synthase N-terminal-like domain-containing protein [Fulvivirga kasyanovii]|uniref:Beta-ketoacyl synthase n=1 Tax=Fulvivirga kasyanovii TaxID=396812 RepID=A0ABW9RNR5_9BACT|nr:beta-ketoacyl synthase N-terminal-like domain-containing protein [Fulvivirga kasyanovii]MTI25663.1 beta-ketoacyl synthase [Fulvivirga kasyanovii]
MEIYSVADNIVSPLGTNTEANYAACRGGISGIANIQNGDLYPEQFYGAAIGEDIKRALNISEDNGYTFLEQLFIHSVSDALSHVKDLDKNRTLLVISTTKGNIDLLSESYTGPMDTKRSELTVMGNTIARYFDLPNAPVIVSNACISGLSAIITAKRLIEVGQYDHAIVAGGDILSEFVVSGFQCLKAISDEPCRPYDARRKGISLGEACGTMILTRDVTLAKNKGQAVRILSGSQSNDANHISGPSRTGEGLKLAVKRALEQTDITASQISYISAHGTATLFNDEMEAIVFDTLGLSDTPLNSLKGYFGHTLGAAGVIESIITMKQMLERELVASQGFQETGTTKTLNIIQATKAVAACEYALKTTSGFGGCNAAVVYKSL